MKKFLETTQIDPALEQLEIEKLIENEEHAESVSVFDSIISDVKDDEDKPDKVESNQEEPEPASDAAQAPPDVSSPPGERITGEDDLPESDSPTKEDKPELTEEEQEQIGDVTSEEEPQITTEHLRSYLSAESFRIALEGPTNYDDVDHQQRQFYDPTDWAKWGREKVSGIGVDKESIKHFGGKIYKGIAEGFRRLSSTFGVALAALDQYLTRRMNSFSKLHTSIQSAKEAVELIKSSSKAAADLSGTPFIDKRTIRYLCINGRYESDANIKVLGSFVGSMIDDLGISIKEDLTVIEELITRSHVGNTEDVLKLLAVHVKFHNLEQGEIDGFQSTSQLVSSYHVSTVLPGDAVLIMHLPTSDTKTREEWIQAYHESNMFLGIDRSSLKIVEQIPFTTPDVLAQILTSLDELCSLCIKHQHFYETMKASKLQQRLAYKSYFDSLVQREKKAGLKESLLDLIRMKNNFLDRVYLPAAIDTHDYCVRVINAYLRYIEMNLKALR